MAHALRRSAAASFLAYLIRFVFLLVGLALATFGAWQFYSSYAFQQTAVETTAEVLSVDAVTRTERNSDGYLETTTTYAPTLRYTDLSGAAHVSTPYLRSSEYNFPIGSEIEVLYDAAAPGDVRISGFLTTWGFGAAFFLFGLLFAVIGCWRSRPEDDDLGHYGGAVERLR